MTSFTNKNVLNLLRNLPRLSLSNLRNNDGAVKKINEVEPNTEVTNMGMEIKDQKPGKIL